GGLRIDCIDHTNRDLRIGCKRDSERTRLRALRLLRELRLWCGGRVIIPLGIARLGRRAGLTVERNRPHLIDFVCLYAAAHIEAELARAATQVCTLDYIAVFKVKPVSAGNAGHRDQKRGKCIKTHKKLRFDSNCWTRPPGRGLHKPCRNYLPPVAPMCG